MRRTLRHTKSALVGLALTAAILTGPVLVSPTLAVEPTGPSTGAEAPSLPVTSVVAVSIDGLMPRAISKLGPERTPVLHRLRHEGASTLNARTARERTETLPNHTSMVTSRRIKASRGGHGVTWNDARSEPRTVQEAAGHDVASMFSEVSASGGGTALFASKQKFSLFERSWSEGLDRFLMRKNNARLVRRARADIRNQSRAARFVHLSRPDVVGHRQGFMSSAYLDAVARADELLGQILATVEASELPGRTVLVVTSDHGGSGTSHGDPTKRANYRIPFLVWGPGVAQGADLYELNPDYENPGRRRTGYVADRQPVRNGMVANLVTSLLGFGPVPGSEHNAAHDLDVR